MKYEPTENEEVELNMTSMIDIVFQLLVFFIMTFKIVAQEGDFNIRMPLAASSPDSMEEDPPELIHVILKAGDDGVISSIDVDDEIQVKTLTGATIDELYVGLNNYIVAKVAGGNDPEAGIETEVEFDIDASLHYGYTVKAIESVSGQQLANGSVKKLIENIKLKNNTGG